MLFVLCINDLCHLIHSCVTAKLFVVHTSYYSAPVGVRSIVINPSVCLCVYVCLSIREHISETTGPIGTKF